MMNIRNRSVNVNRLDLLKALNANLEIHRREYAQALIDFKTRLAEDLQAAIAKVEASEPAALKDFNIQVSFPDNHERDFVEVIEMLEMSVDTNINLDSDSFRAYVKNEWAWTSHFQTLAESYKISGAFLS